MYRSQPLSKDATFGQKKRWTFIALALLGGIVLTRITYLAVFQHEKLSADAVRNTEVITRLEAPRGDIHDRNGILVAYNEDRYRVTFVKRGLNEEEIEDSLNRLSRLWNSDLTANSEAILAHSDPWREHELAKRKTLEEVLAVQETPELYPGVRLQKSDRRRYPFGHHLAMIVGHMGPIQEHQSADFTRPLYLPNALIGQSGLEKTFEPQLVGKRGELRKRVNSRRELITTPEMLEPAQAGDALHLTVDALWQAKAMELLGEKTGSIVVMDVHTGALLVLASTPTFNPEQPGTPVVEGQEPSFFHRAIQGLYPPGSTFKIVTATARLQNGGLFSSDQEVCTGSSQWPGWLRPFHCDNRAGHGSIGMEAALKGSCNVYFFESGKMLGGDILGDSARAFGYAVPTGIELQGEATGQLQKEKDFPEGAEIFNFSIGQGELLCTPLQVAKSFALLANGGKPVVPHVVDRVGENPFTPVTEQFDWPVLSAAQRERIVGGLWRATNELGGTAYKVGFRKEWGVVGKTGTAEKGGDRLDAWFAGYYPRTAPKYAFVAHVEEANAHGGEIAAPLIRELIEWMENPEPIVEPAPDSNTEVTEPLPASPEE
jgi:penicillin-binding protein 2